MEWYVLVGIVINLVQGIIWLIEFCILFRWEKTFIYKLLHAATIAALFQIYADFYVQCILWHQLYFSGKGSNVMKMILRRDSRLWYCYLFTRNFQVILIRMLTRSFKRKFVRIRSFIFRILATNFKGNLSGLSISEVTVYSMHTDKVTKSFILLD